MHKIMISEAEREGEEERGGGEGRRRGEEERGGGEGRRRGRVRL